MEAEDLKVGDKVKPLQRTIHHPGGEIIKSAEHSLVYRQALSRGQKYLYVYQINFNTKSGIPSVRCTITPNDCCYDDFDDVDLVPYKEIPFIEGKEIQEINERLELEAEARFGGMWPDQS